MPEQFENSRKLDDKTRCKTLMPKKCAYTLRIDQYRSKSGQNVLFSSFSIVYTMPFQNFRVRVPFSKSTVFKIYRQKMCRFRVNGRPIRRIFDRFQNVPASCERSLSFHSKMRQYRIPPLLLVNCTFPWVSCCLGGIMRYKDDMYNAISFHFIFNFLGMVAPQLEKTDLQGAMQ